jgi:hypothetical protein
MRKKDSKGYIPYFTKMVAMRNIADVIGVKPIAP